MGYCDISVARVIFARVFSLEKNNWQVVFTFTQYYRYKRTKFDSWNIPCSQFQIYCFSLLSLVSHVPTKLQDSLWDGRDDFVN